MLLKDDGRGRLCRAGDIPAEIREAGITVEDVAEAGGSPSSRPRDRRAWSSREPNANPAGRTFQDALFEQGIPATAFESSDIHAECVALWAKGRGVHA